MTYEGLSIIYVYIALTFFIFSGVLVIISKNPIISVLFLIFLFLSISVYLILVDIKFIGISYLLVYVGAVSILFLFILMLLDIRISELQTNTNNSIFLGIIMSILFYNIINDNIYVFILKNNLQSVIEKGNIILLEYSDITAIGNVIYTNVFIWLIISLLILLLAMVGAIKINIKN